MNKMDMKRSRWLFLLEIALALLFIGLVLFIVYLAV